MGCKECGKPKCNGECGCKSPKVLQINNPAEYITFHKVSIPAAMGDSTTNPPKIGAYRNALVYYEADHTSWMYSTDGIPTKLTNGLTDYNEAVNLPQINGETLIGDKSGAELGLQDKLIAGDNIQINGNTISATNTTYTAGNGIELDGTVIEVKIGDGLEFDSNGEIDIADVEQHAHFFDTVADMKAATSLIDGSFARTLGYYAKNDGGGALYSISATELTNEWQEQLNNGLYANLIYDNVLHINQLGADNTGVTDSSTVINEALEFINTRWTNGIFDLDTLVFNGVYLINSQIEMSPFCKLTGDGYVTFKTNVQEGTSVFWIHYPNGVIPDSFAGRKLQYQYANLLDFPRGCLFKNINGSRKTTAIELGEHSDVENKKNVSRFKLCNFSVENYAIALQYNSFDIYICNHERLQLENNDVNVKFGTNGVGKANAGEHMLFDNCLFAGRGIGFLYETSGFDLEVVNSSIDFLDYVVTDPYAKGYHKIAISTTHIEGCKHLLGTIGTPNLVNIINNHLIFHIDETGNNGEQLITLEDNLSNKTAEQLSEGVCNITDCYLTSELKSMYDPANMTFTPYMQVFFKDNKWQDLNARLFLTKGNILSDALDGANTGAVTLAGGSYFGKNNIFKIVNFIGFKSEGTIIQDNYGYTGHKSLQLLRDDSASNPAINFETVLLPVKKSEYYASLFTFNKKSGNSIRFYWYDKDGNELGETSSYVYSPTNPSADTWFMNQRCKDAVIPPDACFFKVVFYCGKWQGDNTDPENTAYKLGGVIIN